MKKLFRKLAVYGSAFMLAVSAFAEGSAADTLITSAQTEVTGYITALSTALAAVLTAGIALKALPWVARKVGAFFRG